MDISSDVKFSGNSGYYLVAHYENMAAHYQLQPYLEKIHFFTCVQSSVFDMKISGEE
jgi:hypothetical protein